MRSVQTHGSAHARRARASPACLARLAPDTGAVSPMLSALLSIPHPSSCRPSLQTVSRPSTLLWRLCHSRRVSVPAGDPRLTSHRLPAVPAPITRQASRRRFPPCLSAPDSASPLPFTCGYLGPWGGSGLRRSLAGSPACLAESSSSSSGPVVHLPLLPTPPRGGAVAFDYARMHARAAGTSTPLSVCAHGRTRIAPRRATLPDHRTYGSRIRRFGCSGRHFSLSIPEEQVRGHG